MKIKVKLGVDAGNISLLDSAYITEHGGTVGMQSDFRLVLSVKPGRYAVSLKALKTWQGPASVIGEIDVQGDALVLGDACYSWTDNHDAWSKFLDRTDYLKRLSDDGRGVVMDTGGDGSFSVSVTIKALP